MKWCGLALSVGFSLVSAVALAQGLGTVEMVAGANSPGPTISGTPSGVTYVIPSNGHVFAMSADVNYLLGLAFSFAKGSVPTCTGGQFVNGPGSCGTPSAAGGTRVEVAKTSNYSVVSGDAGTDFSNAGAGSGITFTLPAWASGLNYCFSNPTNQTITIQADTGNFITEFGVSTAGAGTAVSGAQYSMLCVVANTSAIWQIDRHIGNWNLT